MIPAISPNMSILLNFLMGAAALSESTGLTNIITTQGGKAGAVAAGILALANMFLHGASSSTPGPIAPVDPAPSAAQGRNNPTRMPPAA